MCKQNETGNCVYGDKMCWFIHENKNEEKGNNTDDDSLMRRLVEMVEKITKQLIEIKDSKRNENE